MEELGLWVVALLAVVGAPVMLVRALFEAGAIFVDRSRDRGRLVESLQWFGYCVAYLCFFYVWMWWVMA